MALTKETVIDKIEVLEDGTIQVRTATYILEDGKRITDPQYHRVAYSPGDVTPGVGAKVAAIRDVVWTPTVVADYKTKQAAMAAKLAADLDDGKAGK